MVKNTLQKHLHLVSSCTDSVQTRNRSPFNFPTKEKVPMLIQTPHGTGSRTPLVQSAGYGLRPRNEPHQSLRSRILLFEAGSMSAGQGVRLFSQDNSAHYFIHSTSTLELRSLIRQINLVNAFGTYLFKIQFNIILPSITRSHTCSLSSYFFLN